MKALVRPSVQDRSRATEDRILKATARLLQTDTFETISVRKIVAEAQTSIGSFYARFRDKDALLPVLNVRNEHKLIGRIKRLRRSIADANSLFDAADSTAAHLILRYGDVPNLQRALFEFAMREPDSPEATALSARRTEQYRFLHEAFLEYEHEIVHPDPRRAVELGLYFVAVTCRTRMFYPRAPQARTIRISKRELRRELTRLFVGYLTA
ncbi:MAG: helix-turn-helix domain-containing protein [Woeseiaceae bacterium]|nr:helix-turn-helix domain-containing protein [Woeseiaceae bacterium]